MRIIYFILCFFILLPSTALSQRKYLFTWDEGSGTNMPGWTWSNDVAYGDRGWLINQNGPFGGRKTFSWGDGPRCFEKADQNTDTTAEIISNDIAPSTTAGGALKVYDTGNVSYRHAEWWVWYDGEFLQQRGITDANTDRFSFYIKLAGISGNTPDSVASMFDVGTYLTDDTNCPSYGTEDGAPYEGPGNQHYYHYLYMSPGAWIHVELDRHPSHKRGEHVSGNDPAFISPSTDQCDPVVSHAMHYYEHLHQFYMEISYDQNENTSFLLDDLYFYDTNDPTESAEPNQNDISVTSLWVGYWETTGKWQIGWMDESFQNSSGTNLNDNTNSTFELRWSTHPITNSNYQDAEVVQPEWFSSPNYTSYPNGIRRKSPDIARIYTQFDLPSGIEDANDKIYFAIKDVSKNDGSTAGTQWPYTLPDGHDAPTSNIKTIDYYIRPDGSSPTCDASHLSLCNDSTSCQGVGGNWCGGVCKSTPCVTAFNCGSVPLMQVH